MGIDMQSKILCRLYKIAGCIFIWVAYTYMIVQLFKLNVRTPDAKKLDFAPETYETDQKASVCFKDVIPFSVPLIQGSEICQNKPDLLIMIHTEADNIDIRNAFREEFSNRIRNTSAKYDFKLDVVYLIGLNERYCILAKTVEEIVTFKDILVGSFIDSYYNQTLKSITMLEWFTKYCKSATVLLKLDERMDPAKSLDGDNFYSLIRNVRNEDKLILGSVTEVEVTSRQHIPWISLSYLYPGLPRNLHLNYLLSRDSAESLLKAYADTIYISVWKEDLYITGILANVAKLKITPNDNFLMRCGITVCTFCTCGWSLSIQDREFTSTIVPSTSTANDLATSDKLVHSIPKRDTQAALQMYSSQPITTATYPSTEHRGEWDTTASTVNPTTELRTESTISAEVTTEYTATGSESTLSADFTTQYTTTDGTTGTTSLQDAVVTSTTSMMTNTDSTFHTTNALRDDTPATPAQLLTTKATTITANEEFSTITEIIETISLTDIPILQIDEFELGFNPAFQDEIAQNLDPEGAYSTWNAIVEQLSMNETTSPTTFRDRIESINSSDNDTSTTEDNSAISMNETTSPTTFRDRIESINSSDNDTSTTEDNSANIKSTTSVRESGTVIVDDHVTTVFTADQINSVAPSTIVNRKAFQDDANFNDLTTEYFSTTSPSPLQTTQ